jgi:hypothetical protein
MLQCVVKRNWFDKSEIYTNRFIIVRLEQQDGSLLQLESEEAIYQHFGSEWIAPALREDGSEFDKAYEYLH